MTTPNRSLHFAVCVGLCAALLAACASSGCDDAKKGAAKYGTKTLKLAGDFIVLIPHPLAKVIGAVLIAGGGALEIFYDEPDGGRQTATIELTPEQKQEIKDAFEKNPQAQEVEITVKGPDGNSVITTIKRP